MRKKFKIVQMKKPIQGNTGKWRLECETKRGVCVVFWGTYHIPEIMKHKLPFHVSCDCTIPPKGAMTSLCHDYWVPEKYKLTVTESSEIKGGIQC